MDKLKLVSVKDTEHEKEYSVMIGDTYIGSVYKDYEYPEGEGPEYDGWEYEYHIGAMVWGSGFETKEDAVRALIMDFRHRLDVYRLLPFE